MTEAIEGLTSDSNEPELEVTKKFESIMNTEIQGNEIKPSQWKVRVVGNNKNN